jgi:hypothetical protein
MTLPSPTPKALKKRAIGRRGVTTLQKYELVTVLIKFWSLVREPWELEPHGRTYHWSVYDVVKFEFGFAGPLRIVPPGCRGSHRPAVVGANCLP